MNTAEEMRKIAEENKKEPMLRVYNKILKEIRSSAEYGIKCVGSYDFSYTEKEMEYIKLKLENEGFFTNIISHKWVFSRPRYELRVSLEEESVAMRGKPKDE
jgi:hypothetical protein